MLESDFQLGLEETALVTFLVPRCSALPTLAFCISLLLTKAGQALFPAAPQASQWPY